MAGNGRRGFLKWLPVAPLAAPAVVQQAQAALQRMSAGAQQGLGSVPAATQSAVDYVNKAGSVSFRLAQNNTVLEKVDDFADVGQRVTPIALQRTAHGVTAFVNESTAIVGRTAQEVLAKAQVWAAEWMKYGNSIAAIEPK